MGKAIGWAAVLCAMAALGAAPTAVGTSADEMAKQIESMKPPALDPAKRDDQDAVQRYIAAREEWESNRDRQVRAFYGAYPDDARAMKMMSENWIMMAQSGQAKEVLQDTANALPKAKTDEQKEQVLFAMGVAGILGDDPATATKATEALIAVAPKDPRGATLLDGLAHTEHDAAKQKVLLQRIVDQYGQLPEADSAKGKLRQMDGVGKPFELMFTDAISGKEISLQKDLQGKVVVVDFWATWCPPCVASMPANKAIYEKYKDKGVAFVGVDLDQPGDVEKLKDFVEKNGIAWPQYYQGKGWDSEFSKGWGIDSIPTMFVVDKQGNLASVDADGKLESLLPQLLAK